MAAAVNRSRGSGGGGRSDGFAVQPASNAAAKTADKLRARTVGAVSISTLRQACGQRGANNARIGTQRSDSHRRAAGEGMDKSLRFFGNSTA